MIYESLLNKMTLELFSFDKLDKFTKFTIISNVKLN